MQKWGYSSGAGPRPRLVQGGFFLLLLADVVRRLVVDDLPFLSPPVAAAVVGLVVTVAVAYLDPQVTTAGHVAAVVSLLDLAILGVAVATAGASPVTPALAVLPACWLGLRYGARGVLIALLATLALIGPAQLAGGAATRDDLSSLAFLPLLAAIAALTARSVTQWAISERDLAEQRAVALSVVLDTVDVGIMVLDREGRVVTHNSTDASFRSQGHPSGFPGLYDRPREVFALDGSPLTNEQRPTVLAVSGTEYDDYRVWVGSDPATRRALSLSARSVRDASGTHVGAVVATRDITTVTRALRSRDDFVASVSHELRTPLASLLGYVHLLAQQPSLSASALADLEGVRRGADRLAGLVGDLVHSATVEAPDLDLDRTHADLRSLLETVTESHRELAAAAGVEIEVDAPHGVWAPLDRDRVQEVLATLLTRAVARSPRGSRVRLGVTLEGARVQISVVDDGDVLGLAARQELALALSDESAQSAGRISSRAVVEAHGGRIDVDDDLAQGSAVRIRLPLGGRT